MHLRAEVAGIDSVDPEVRMLRAEHRGQLLERSLRRSIAAPTLVRLDGCVRGDVDDARARMQSRQCCLHQCERREDIHLVDLPNDIERVVRKLGLRASGRDSWRC